jgi:hypothetical protein
MLVALSDVQMVDAIFNFIHHEGNEIAENNYRLGNLVASLKDETERTGCTIAVQSLASAHCFMSEAPVDSDCEIRDRQVRYIFGTENDLNELYEAIFGQ